MTPEIRSRIKILYQAAWSDGNVADEEIAFLKSYCSKNGVDFNSIENDSIEDDDFILPDNLVSRLQILFEVAELCLADQVLDGKELEYLKTTAKMLDVKPENIESLVNEFIKLVQEGKTFNQLNL